MEINPARQAALDDLYDHLRRKGYGAVLDALPDCLTSGKPGRQQRVFLSKLAQALGVTGSQASEILDGLRAEIREQGGE